jgi:hypothetical protein
LMKSPKEKVRSGVWICLVVRLDGQHGRSLVNPVKPLKTTVALVGTASSVVYSFMIKDGCSDLQLY